jgi:hypothetical protein
MANISVTPEEFTMVDFSAAAIVDIAGRVFEQVNIVDISEVRIEIDEASPLARASIKSTDPLTLAVEGGAFEDTRRPRQLSEDRTADTIGRYILKATDRMSDGFADAPVDDDLTLAQTVAWDVYCVGRLVRSGFKGQRKRRVYQFRNRHGFSDAADAAFEALWTSQDLVWADIDRISQEAIAASGLA